MNHSERNHGESGNYKGYYKNRPVTFDHRITLLQECPLIDFKGKVVLDIGSNDGSFTMAAAERFQPKFILGIDPDNRLIESALALLNRSIHKTQKPGTCIEENQRGSSIKNLRSISSFKPRSVSQIVKPRSISQEFSKKEIVSVSAPSIDNLFPSNVQFHCKGCNDMKSTGAYDILLCLSVSKWIHLNEGDDGLHRFFRQLMNLCKPG